MSRIASIAPLSVAVLSLLGAPTLQPPAYAQQAAPPQQPPQPTGEAAVPQALSLVQCAKLALDNDVALFVAKQRERRAQAVFEAERGRFLPAVRAEAGFRRQILGTELEVVDRRGRFAESTPTLQAGLSGQAITGLNYDVRVGSDMTWTTQRSAIISPIFRNRIEVEISHPLLKDFGIKATTAGREAADLSRVAAQHQVHAEELNALATVVAAYWALYHAHTTRAVFVQSVRQMAAHRAAIDTLPSRIKPNPALAHISEAQLANWQVELGWAESEQLAVERQLLRLVYARQEPSAQLIRQGVQPSDRPVIAPVEQSLDTLTARALKQRPDLESLQAQISAQKLRLLRAENQALPQLDAYLVAGLHSFAGRQTLNRSGFDQVTLPAPAEIRGKYGDAWEQLFEGKLPFIELGLRFQLPISGAVRREESISARTLLAQLQRQQQRASAEVEVRVREAYLRVKNDESRFRRAQLAYEGIATRLEAVGTAFGNGGVNTMAVVNALRLLRDAGQALALSGAEYMMSRALLEETMGTLKTYLGLDEGEGQPINDPVDEVLSATKASSAPQ